MNISPGGRSPYPLPQSPALPPSRTLPPALNEPHRSSAPDLSKPDLAKPSLPKPGLESHGQPRFDADAMEEAFTDFVGQTLFGSMLQSMRSTVGKPAYFHGGRTEEVFQQQLDQHIVEDLTEASADSLASPMFELFNLQRRA